MPNKIQKQMKKVMKINPKNKYSFTSKLSNTSKEKIWLYTALKIQRNKHYARLKAEQSPKRRDLSGGKDECLAVGMDNINVSFTIKIILAS
jgi:hypothetical protein